MVTSLLPNYTGLFPEIENLDVNIYQELVNIQGVTEVRPAIAVCNIDLPPGELFRISGTQYGVFLVISKNNETFIRGVRTEREHGTGAHRPVVKAFVEALKAFGMEVPQLVEFKHRIVEAN